MSSKPVRIALLVLLALSFSLGCFGSGLVVGLRAPATTSAFINRVLEQLPLIPTPAATPGTSLETLFKPFWQAWDLVHEQYVDQPVDDEALMRGAIRGMLEALNDPHTGYMDPFEFQQANAPLEGEYEGIGAWVDTSGEFLTIISPMPDSPAEKAGLKAGDKIIAVDGEDMTGVDPSLVLRRVLGPAGSTVTLTIQREGEPSPFEVRIVRQKITIPSVEGKMLDQHIAYVRLFTFGEKTASDLRRTLTDLLDQKPVGIILDLRNNGGGYLNAAIDVSSEFIKDGVIMYEVYGDGRKISYRAKGNGIATDIPLVVVVNEGTASASEITAGAIQDYQQGKLVGTKTFGKGSVQSWTPLVNNEGAVRITIARWLTPQERQINGVGLTPDVEVPLTEEDLKAGRDPQLDRAIQLLLQE
ncbi:S41 family peptidase [Thermanaerothrix sp. 4228-RoL]|uniref:S41 family peptidase n=1 Tax=Thermanaerothrix solaris TaxID=3058434 RepID=A0ABU3NIR7_9CHLR|nr:S41 family peptidase [Thermanaerothrix sp. 4228-RoL]MDT8896739.1 S41 family peptidase [Thermanaerothrix sp. 4228-RoL]